MSKHGNFNTNSLPTLCLNMIVKNESRIIVRLLESVYTLIDSYCICDTGSTDNTVELIRDFFDSKQIPGQIVFEPFCDFAYNRTFSLKACENQENADYILLLDADMILENRGHVSASDLKARLTADAYYVFQGSDCFYYKNVRVLKNNRGFTYWGVTHEYVNAPANSVYDTIPRDVLFINDVGDGGAKSDKFLRDIRLLTKGLEDNPDNDRYTFYLANSYRESGQIEKAIEYYEKRVALGGWFEEVWYSLFNIGRCYKDLGDPARMVHYFMEAYQLFPKRIENLFEIVHYYRVLGKNQLAYTYFTIADKERARYPAEDYLFMQKDIYDYKLDYELSIIGYYVNPDKYDMIKTSMKILNYPHSEKGICDNVLSNYKFYAKKIVDLATPISPRNQQTLVTIGRGRGLSDQGRGLSDQEFVSSTPSLAVLNENELAICVRYVNYKINADGGYENGEHISTKNIIAILDTSSPDDWSVISEFELQYDTQYDGLYVGLEDVRLFCSGPPNNRLFYNANRGLDRHKIAVEHGDINIFRETTNGPSNLLRIEGDIHDIEKNWVLFETADHSLKCIYKWFPLQIGDIDGSNWNKTHELPMPHFFQYMRGSTNGILVNGNTASQDEIWFINHLVSYESRRYYYHVITVLDRNTLTLKKYTAPWTFEGNAVEYTLGFTYNHSTRQFLIGYSIMDRETHYIQVPRFAFDSQFINL